MSKREKSIWVSDLECTTEVDWREEGLVRCYLWHARRLNSEEVRMGYDIDSLLEFFREADTVWYHNLKYDGSFVLARILEQEWEFGGKQDRKQPRYDHIVTDTGQWMVMTLRFGNHVCKLCDSAKKFPGLSLEEVAKVYGIPGKSELDVNVRREPGRAVTQEEIERVEGDTRILKVAMEDLFARGMTGLTMASDAMNFFKKLHEAKHGRYAKRQWMRDYPSFTPEQDAWIREAYKGGYVMTNPRYRGVPLLDVSVIDKNSMYPSWMHSSSGARLPYGRAIKRKKPGRGELYIVQFDCIFKLKPHHLPTIQKKGDFRYVQSEYIEESSTYMHLCLTSVDYELFKEQYDVYHETNHEYLCFYSRTGDYDEYIDYWMGEKEKCSEAGDDAGRATAKRFLNSLYGKRGENPIKRSKISYLDDEGVVRWETVEEVKDSEYIPHACFITAYARADIVRNCQKFMARDDTETDDFIYCDTDSIHCINVAKHIHEMAIHDTKLNHWKVEGFAMVGKYIGPKKYCHLGEWDGKKITPFTVACAGMPNGCKENVRFEDFELGARYEGKLMGRTVRGGYCLIETTFKIKVR